LLVEIKNSCPSRKLILAVITEDFLLR
jgi:hypothetical protein